VADVRIVHLGDNGPVGSDTARQLGRVDVLMIPIDSQFHILKANQIADIRSKLSPRVMIPMHYRHDDLELDPKRPDLLGGIDEWAKGEPTVRYLPLHKQDFSFRRCRENPKSLFSNIPLLSNLRPRYRSQSNDKPPRSL
jgi:hypothetical protein